MEAGELEGFVEDDEVGLDFAGAHKPDAGEEDVVDVEEGFDAARVFFEEEVPLSFGEAEIVMGSLFSIPNNSGFTTVQNGFKPSSLWMSRMFSGM